MKLIYIRLKYHHLVGTIDCARNNFLNFRSAFVLFFNITLCYQIYNSSKWLEITCYVSIIYKNYIKMYFHIIITFFYFDLTYISSISFISVSALFYYLKNISWESKINSILMKRMCLVLDLLHGTMYEWWKSKYLR